MVPFTNLSLLVRSSFFVSPSVLTGSIHKIFWKHRQILFYLGQSGIFLYFRPSLTFKLLLSSRSEHNRKLMVTVTKKVGCTVCKCMPKFLVILYALLSMHVWLLTSLLHRQKVLVLNHSITYKHAKFKPTATAVDENVNETFMFSYSQYIDLGIFVCYVKTLPEHLLFSATAQININSSSRRRTWGWQMDRGRVAFKEIKAEALISLLWTDSEKKNSGNTVEAWKNR